MIDTIPEGLLERQRDKWIERCLYTPPKKYDDEYVAGVVAEIYRSGGLEPPEVIIRVASPWAGARAYAAVLQLADDADADTIRAAVALAISDNSEQGLLTQNWTPSSLGQFADWLAYYDTMRELGVTGIDRLDGHFAAVDIGSFFWPFERVVIIAARCETLQRDGNGRLHNPSGPAISWLDGWGVWAWHGTRVPRELIEDPETLATPEWIAEQDNSEIIRAAGERLGWAEFVKRVGLVSIDVWTDPKQNLRYELLDWANRPDDIAPRFLRMKSPVVKTGDQPEYIEPVHPALRTARGARRWQFPCNLSGDAIRHGDVVIDGGQDAFEWPDPAWCEANPDLVFTDEA